MKVTLNTLAGAGLPAMGVKRPWLVTVINLLIAIAGLVAIFAIEVRELPDVDEPVVNVRANLPGASPETMDGEVTRILEDPRRRSDACWCWRRTQPRNCRPGWPQKQASVPISRLNALTLAVQRPPLFTPVSARRGGRGASSPRTCFRSRAG